MKQTKQNQKKTTVDGPFHHHSTHYTRIQAGRHKHSHLHIYTIVCCLRLIQDSDFVPAYIMSFSRHVKVQSVLSTGRIRQKWNIVILRVSITVSLENKNCCVFV